MNILRENGRFVKGSAVKYPDKICAICGAGFSKRFDVSKKLWEKDINNGVRPINILERTKNAEV